MKGITHKDKNGKVIKDLSKVKLPKELEISLFKILNPDLSIEEVRFRGAS